MYAAPPEPLEGSADINANSGREAIVKRVGRARLQSCRKKRVSRALAPGAWDPTCKSDLRMKTNTLWPLKPGRLEGDSGVCTGDDMRSLERLEPGGRRNPAAKLRR